MRAQWKALEALKAAGQTVSIGVSNFCKQCLECLASDPAGASVPVVNQIELHVGMGPDPEGLRSYCMSKNILPQAFSPLGTWKHADLLVGLLSILIALFRPSTTRRSTGVQQHQHHYHLEASVSSLCRVFHANAPYFY